MKGRGVLAVVLEVGSVRWSFELESVEDGEVEYEK
jgi:hypothetical protein